MVNLIFQLVAHLVLKGDRLIGANKTQKQGSSSDAALSYRVTKSSAKGNFGHLRSLEQQAYACI